MARCSWCLNFEMIDGRSAVANQFARLFMMMLDSGADDEVKVQNDDDRRNDEKVQSQAIE